MALGSRSSSETPQGALVIGLFVSVALCAMIAPTVAHLPNGNVPTTRASSLGPMGSGSSYSVTFTSLNLSSGAVWNLTVSGRTWTTANTSLVIQETNGTYAYSAFSATAHRGFVPAYAYVNGSVTVDGTPTLVRLDWSSHPPEVVPPSSASAGVATSAPIAFLAAAAAAILLVLVVLAVAVRGRRVRPIPPSVPTVVRPIRGPATAPEAPRLQPAGPDPLRHML